MKTILLLLLFTSFLGIAVFGFVGMRGHDENHRGGCIASLAQKAPCEADFDGVALAFFHVGAFKNFSRSLLGEGGVFIALILIAVLGILVWARAPDALPLRYRYTRGASFFATLWGSWRRFFQPWLSFHEHSPSYW